MGNRPFRDLTGTTVSFWYVIELESSGKNEKGTVFRKWKCSCTNCKAEHVVLEDSMRQTTADSCQLCRTDKRKKSDTERCRKSNEYNAWRYINSGQKKYPVADQWKGNDGYPQFLKDLGFKPKKAKQSNIRYRLSLRDPEKGYAPGNCFWKPYRYNFTRSIYKYQGEKYTLSELTFITEVPYDTLWRRLKSGMTPTEAVNTSTTIGKQYVAFGESKSWTQWMADPRRAVNINIVRKRLEVKKWTFQRALTTPAQPTPARTFIAFGEEKTVRQWLQDPRLGKGVTKRNLNARLRKSKSVPDNEKAISSDAQLFGMNNKIKKVAFTPEMNLV